jgi:hypothetical protein
MTIAPARSILACVTLVVLVPALVLAQELRPEDLTTFIERGSAEYAYSGDLEAISQMPEENAGAGELDHAEEVLGVILPASHGAAEVLEPHEEALDLPAPAGATQRAPVLGARTAAPMRGDHLDAVRREQGVVEAVAVVAAVADQSFGKVREEARVERGGDEVRLIR